MTQAKRSLATLLMVLLACLSFAGCAAVRPLKVTLPLVYAQAAPGHPEPALIIRYKSGGYWYLSSLWEWLGDLGFFMRSTGIKYPSKGWGHFPERGVALHGANVLVLEDRLDLDVQEETRYLVHTLDRASGKVSATVPTRTVKKATLGTYFYHAHTWLGGLLVLQERLRSGRRVFSSYDPLTNRAMEHQTDDDFLAQGVSSLGQMRSDMPAGSIYFTFRGRRYLVGWSGGEKRYTATGTSVSAHEARERLFWAGDLEKGKVLWRQGFGPTKQAQEIRGLDIHLVPGTDLLKISWDYIDSDLSRRLGWRRVVERGDPGNWANLACGARPFTGQYRVVRLETGEVVEGGTYDKPGTLAWLNRGCKEGLICWEGSDVVLRDRDTSRELARRTVPHLVRQVYRPYLGDDVWIFCTAGKEQGRLAIYLDVYTPGLREHLASERLVPEECFPPLPQAARKEIAESCWTPFDENTLWFGVRKVGDHFVVGPWPVPNPFSYYWTPGWVFVEVTPDGKFSGTSLLFLPKRERTHTDSVTSLFVEGSRIWLADESSLTLIDWEGSGNKKQQ